MLAALGLVRAKPAEDPVEPELWGGASSLDDAPAFADVNRELKRAYPPGFFAAQVEKRSVFLRHLRGGR